MFLRIGADHLARFPLTKLIEKRDRIARQGINLTRGGCRTKRRLAKACARQQIRDDLSRMIHHHPKSGGWCYPTNIAPSPAGVPYQSPVVGYFGNLLVHRQLLGNFWAYEMPALSS